MTLPFHFEAKFASLRSQFPMLSQSMHGKPLIYLDSAATAQKPQSVIDAITQFYSSHYGTVHRAIYEISVHASKLYEKTREDVRQFLHAKHAEEIIFTRGTTESINLIAYSFGKAFVKLGDEILISAMEHHSNIVPWQILCEDRGAVLKVIPMDDKGELLLDEYLRLLTPKTRLVSITHLSNSLGTINPIKEMISLAHNVGAKVVVDGAQSTPHMPIDVQDLDVDFFVFSGHKLYGPTGIGVLYGKSELLNQMPPYQGGGDMIETVTFEKTTYNHLPLKFEAGTPLIAEAIALGASVNFLKKIGMESILTWVDHLASIAESALKTIPGLKILGQAKEKGPIITFAMEGVHPLDVGSLLDVKGIAIRTGHLCVQPVMRHFGISSAARVSFGLYNTVEEVQSFVEALKEVLSILAK